jgi:hypothetical protein
MRGLFTVLPGVTVVAIVVNAVVVVRITMAVDARRGARLRLGRVVAHELYCLSAGVSTVGGSCRIIEKYAV